MVERAITVGSDPEIAVVEMNANGDLRVTPVCGLVGGEKGNPVQLDPAIGGWLEDGVMLELNPLPSSNPKEHADRVSSLLTAAGNKLSQIKQRRLHLHYPTTVHYYSEDALEKFPQAKQFGCAQDLSAYNRSGPRECPMPMAMEEFGETVRFVGGHLHLGVTPWPEELPKFIAVRFLDLFLGYPTSRAWGERYGERERHYGLPGLYRETSYGVEYRTPTNRWLKELKTPNALSRLKLIGVIFSKFERYKDELVKIYNAVDWNSFYAAYANRQYGEALTYVSEEVKEDNGTAIRVGGRVMSLRVHGDNWWTDGSLPTSKELGNPTTLERPTAKAGSIAELNTIKEEIAVDLNVARIIAREPGPGDGNVRNVLNERIVAAGADPDMQVLGHRDQIIVHYRYITPQTVRILRQHVGPEILNLFNMGVAQWLNEPGDLLIAEEFFRDTVIRNAARIRLREV